MTDGPITDGPITGGPITGGMVSWRELLAETVRRLVDGGVGSAAEVTPEARWLCETASGLTGAEWVLGQGAMVGARAVARLDAMVERRLTGEPVQYVLGSWAFRHLDLMVDRRVLIPRPETELVAGVAIELALAAPSPRTVVDLGTGSGAIALSLATELPLGSATVWATDTSADALDVARANLVGVGRSGAHVRIEHGSWFDALPDELRGRVDVVVSNPPYVAEGDARLDASVGAWEPASALFGGPDGLAAVREIVAGAPEWLRPGGWLVLEIGAGQGDAVGALLRAARLVDVAVRADPAGHDRVALGRREMKA